jgi:hypothetical protein
MKNRSIFIILSILILIVSVLACNTPIPRVTPAPDITSVEPEGVTVTEPPVLPPPAVATLRVVYIKADNVWLWTEGTGILQLTSAGGARNPVLSGDGQVVAFIRNGELWAVNADGTNERQLVSTAYLAGLASGGDTAEVKTIVWRPGTHMIYFNTVVVAAIVGYRIPQADLLSIDADGSADLVADLESSGSGGEPYFSPDGTIVALSQPDKIIYMEVSGAYWNVALTFANVLTYSEWSYYPEIVWLPDSSGVRVVIPAADPLGDPTQPSTFWNVPVSGTPSILTTFVAAPAFASFPYISPDSNVVLYQAENPGGVEIHSIRSDGMDTFYTSYPSGTVEIEGWTPDSVHFMVHHLPTQINIMAAGEDQVLGDTSVVSKVKWIDSSRFLFLNGVELRISTIGSASSPIDTGVNEYNFGIWVH